MNLQRRRVRYNYARLRSIFKSDHNAGMKVALGQQLGRQVDERAGWQGGRKDIRIACQMVCRHAGMMAGLQQCSQAVRHLGMQAGRLAVSQAGRHRVGRQNGWNAGRKGVRHKESHQLSRRKTYIIFQTGFQNHL